MAQHPILKSIRPVNLLSFGPNTEAIELQPLNILIGPDGSGKSNLIEIMRLMHYLPEKDPWGMVLETGGVEEWVWKGAKGSRPGSSIAAQISWGEPHNERSHGQPLVYEYSIGLESSQNSFRCVEETFRLVGPLEEVHLPNSRLERTGAEGKLYKRTMLPGEMPATFNVSSDRSILSQLATRQVLESQVGVWLPGLIETADFFTRFDFHQDWEFGADLTPRDPIPAGQAVERLEENAYNLAQMLANFRDFHRSVFRRINELMKQFYEPFKSVEVRVIGTHLQIAIQEEGDFSVSAYRLSDGTLRWLALLTILLNPSPPPLTCIEEPELGLHPDIIPTLADLLRDASTRTQLIVTTHSSALVDAFSDVPESICVCEKVEGATQIGRLDKEHLSSWLEDYSLGQLWAKGEIGGNRW